MGISKICIAALALLISPACVGDSCACQYGVPDRDFDRTEVPGTSSTVALPSKWAMVPVPDQGHVAALFAASSYNVVDEVFGAKPSGAVFVRGVGPDDVEKKDAFFSIYVSYPPPFEGPPQWDPVPERFTVEDFEVADEYFGEDVMAFEGEGAGNAVYSVRYWEGPDARKGTTEILQRIVGSLRLEPPRA